MNKIALRGLGLFCGALLLSATSLNAAEAKYYQVTGPVVALTASTITVQKGDDKWELNRNSNTKVKGALKVGSKVTIYYKMIAEEIEVKEAKTGDEGKKKTNDK
jgi:hypothetical protein